MIRPFRGQLPVVPANAYVADSADLIGAVTIGERSSVWFNCAIRADINAITIGDDSNVQDCSVLHVQDDVPLVIGSRVTIGHSATVHACTIEDRTLIGMGSVVLDRAVVGEGSIVAAGAGSGKEASTLLTMVCGLRTATDCVRRITGSSKFAPAIDG